MPEMPGTTTHTSGLTVPDVHNPGATRLLHQTDFQAGHVRMDSNLLLSGDTAIDLLKDAHGSSGLGHVATDAPAVRVPEASFDGGFVHDIGDGHSMARGAIGYGEALEDMTFPELNALANGDVTVTGFHGDGISVRIGEAPPRTFTAQDLANTVPGGPARTDLTGVQAVAGVPNPAGAQHLPGAQGCPARRACRVCPVVRKRSGPRVSARPAIFPARCGRRARTPCPAVSRPRMSRSTPRRPAPSPRPRLCLNRP